VRRYRQLIAVVVFLAVLLAVAQFSGLREHFSLDFVRTKLEANRVSGLLIFVLLFALGNLIQIPGWIFLAAAVIALGRSWGGIATYVAATTSCTCTFFAIRAIGGNALQQLKSPLAVRILAQLQAHPIRSIALLRTLFQTLPAINYALALSGVRFRHYLAGTLLGLPLPIAAYCLFFDQIARLLLPPH